jgi:hypothetical protein
MSELIRLNEVAQQYLPIEDYVYFLKLMKFINNAIKTDISNEPKEDTQISKFGYKTVIDIKMKTSKLNNSNIETEILSMEEFPEFTIYTNIGEDIVQKIKNIKLNIAKLLAQ